MLSILFGKIVAREVARELDQLDFVTKLHEFFNNTWESTRSSGRIIGAVNIVFN